MTECPSCGEQITSRTEKNLTGRPSAKSQPNTCPACGATLEKAFARNNPSLLNK